EDVITTKRVVDHAEGNYLASLISKNKRAITIRVDDVVGVGGFLMPGNHVDVIGIRPIPKTRRVEARTVMKDVVVLAVDQDISPDENKPKVVRAVTLEMLPESTLKVLKAANEGKIQLVLRNPTDKYKIAQAPKKVVKRKVVHKKLPKPKALQVTVIRGTEVDSVKPKS
ncbi:MAG: Flp pilus assembly protein CpaB, partial [Gammaproteobacteria bacterium]|nr:Flp pilus assembly protein CpaB [Gammaproteobacteria bacterium]